MAINHKIFTRLQKFYFVIITAILLFALVSPVFAQYKLDSAAKNLADVRKDTGIADTTVVDVSAGVIRSAYLLIGTFFFILVFYGGITYMTARGAEDKVSKARNTIITAIIGLVITLLAYAITAFFSRII